MSVHVATVDVPERRGGWTTDTDRRLALLESPVRAVLEPYADSHSDVDRITLVPDAHYPFHPSSGMVTDPAVVGSIAAVLQAQTGADIAVSGATDDTIAFDRAAGYLGYPSVLDRFDVDLVDLAEESRRDCVVSVPEQQLSVSVPDRLLESTVIVVPTLRPTRAGSVAGGIRTLGRLTASVADADLTALGAMRAIEPAFSVLDATTAYGGDPIAADTLATGPTPQVDAIGASLLDRSLESDPVLKHALGADEPSITVESATGDDVDLTALRRRLPDGELPPPDDTHPAVSTAYRLYAAVAGDAVPPQLEQRR
ncbi:DUF362 domain-containing protein [Natronorubrum sulfidifaciens]|uniref:DUF362 domain-containing protein n=1 Tax=Natronorubrum sulfidifaciens JCM 14089 TaxID=1230460 RepID=L9WJJ7_9EURY|nr:DUF362 domain-containing protein [Natronorubrum sulfidifaciens]ELY49401.1 hypothetical protein C495_00510 [Natronorubrum sulfidifaciens JCM 14089]